MCVVSAVTGYFEEKWRTPTPTIQPFLPNGSGFVWITKEQWEEYQDLKRIAEQYDARTNQPDCIDPKKAEFEQQVIDVLIKRGVITAVDKD